MRPFTASDAMHRTPGFRPLGRLVLPFVLVVCVLLAGVGWLGWRMLEQDRALERQRVMERLGTGADLVATALADRLTDLDDRLAQIDAAPKPERAARASAVVGLRGDEAVILVFSRGRVPGPGTALLPCRADFPAVFSESLRTRRIPGIPRQGSRGRRHLLP